MSVSEEKVSSDLENSFNKEKLNEVQQDNVEEESNTDAILDEVAAKVNALDFNHADDEPNENDCEDLHAKCMETVKKQGETINTLVQQLRVMFDEYQAVDQEREYYEELNDALIRCLEISEGKIRFESESEKETEAEDRQENVENLIEKQSEEIKPAAEQDKAEEEVTNKTEDMDKKNDEKKESEREDNDDNDQVDDDSSESDVKVLHQTELIRLNRILLREIFELRHQMNVMKENIREYLQTDTEGSEYDTATDEDHICEHCAPTTPNSTAVESKDNEKNESYEVLENENDDRIHDESDTE